eukprot:6484101-Amphidinium_carterae.2
MASPAGNQIIYSCSLDVTSEKGKLQHQQDALVVMRDILAQDCDSLAHSLQQYEEAKKPCLAQRGVACHGSVVITGQEDFSPKQSVPKSLKGVRAKWNESPTYLGDLLGIYSGEFGFEDLREQELGHTLRSRLEKESDKNSYLTLSDLILYVATDCNGT